MKSTAKNSRVFEGIVSSLDCGFQAEGGKMEDILTVGGTEWCSKRRWIRMQRISVAK